MLRKTALNDLKPSSILINKHFYCSLNIGGIVVNIEKILEDSGFNSMAPQEALSKLSSFEEFYSNEEIIEICIYIIKNCSNSELIKGVIRFADSYKDSFILHELLNILLLKIKPNIEADDLIDVRVLCAKAISNYKDTSTVNSLLYCLNNKSENYKIRLACADALGRIGDKYAVAPLINVVQDENEKSVYVKESATFALGLLGDISAIDPLVSIIEAKQGIYDKFSFLKEKIVEALGKLNINNQRVLKVFKMSLMDSSPMVRINTIEALMNSEYDEAPDLIRTALHDPDEEVSKNALIALYNLIGRDILDEVISLPSYSQFLKDEANIIISDYEECEDNDND